MSRSSLLCVFVYIYIFFCVCVCVCVFFVAPRVCLTPDPARTSDCVHVGVRMYACTDMITPLHVCSVYELNSVQQVAGTRM